jgi:hypothetical protein
MDPDDLMEDELVARVKAQNKLYREQMELVLMDVVKHFGARQGLEFLITSALIKAIEANPKPFYEYAWYISTKGEQ